jgi:lipoprotein-anchoring transpeptidase ErfK/SrfK
MRKALDILRVFDETSETAILLVKIDEQRLYLLQGDCVLCDYPVSTSRYGVGYKEGSFQTPLGAHNIAEKIGDDCQPGEIFKVRVPTGKLAEINTDTHETGQDVITSRVLWLRGLEPGINQGGDVDSYRRYIYIHGTAEEGLISQPASIGCIRMKNADVIDLYDRVTVGTPVVIIE